MEQWDACWCGVMFSNQWKLQTRLADSQPSLGLFSPDVPWSTENASQVVLQSHLFLLQSSAFFQNPLKKHGYKYLFVKTARASATFMFYNVKNNFAVLYSLALGYCLQSFHLNPSCCFPFEFKPLFSFKLYRARIMLGGTIIACLKIRIA